MSKGWPTCSTCWSFVALINSSRNDVENIYFVTMPSSFLHVCQNN